MVFIFQAVFVLYDVNVFIFLFQIVLFPGKFFHFGTVFHLLYKSFVLFNFLLVEFFILFQAFNILIQFPVNKERIGVEKNHPHDKKDKYEYIGTTKYQEPFFLFYF